MSEYTGQQTVHSDGSDYNAMEFLVNSIINKLATTMLVKVIAVSNNGEVSPVGTVDVQPAVHQTDGIGQTTEHGIINGLPYFRLQGGTTAVILDPKIGDIGVAVFCSRDISAVKATKDVGGPGSRRKYDWADGVYIGLCLGDAPTQYVRFHDDEIEIKCNTKVTVTSPIVSLSGALQVAGEVTAMFGGASVTLSHHVHGTGSPTAAGTVVPSPGT